MWLQKKFLELFSKKPTIKNDQSSQGAQPEGGVEPVSDIFDEENLKKENLEEKKE